MKFNAPNTPFSTHLSGSAKETQLRIRNIFQWKKERPSVWLFGFIVIVIFGCGGLFMCRDRSDMPELLLEDGTHVYAPMPVLDNPTADIFYQKPGEEKHILMQLPYSAHELDWSTVGLSEFRDVLGKNGVIVSYQLGSAYRTNQYYAIDDTGAYFLTAERADAPELAEQVVNGISPITEASPLSGLSSTQRNWLADLPVAELPKEAVRLNELFPSDLWRDMLIPLAYDEKEDVTIYGVVDLTERPTDDRVVLDLWEMEPYGIVIRKGNRAAYHSLYWGLHLWSAGNPELYVGDFDADGESEVALNLWVGRGTGCSVHQLCIFELDTLTCSAPDYSDLNIGVRYDDASGLATLTGGACELTVEVPEQYRIFDSVSCGNVVSFSCENGQLYMEAGLDFYDTFAYLATVKAPIIYENGTYRLGEVISLTETKY